MPKSIIQPGIDGRGKRSSVMNVLKRYISFSGGVESTTMCILYGKGATAIWCDTGAEHELMYQRIDEVERELKILHDGDFELIRVKSEKHKGLEDYAKLRKYMPSGQARYCTCLLYTSPSPRD